MVTKVTAPARRSLQATGEVGRFVKANYARVKEDKAAGRPVVWQFCLLPKEILVALDVPCVTMEHLPTMLASKQVVGEYLDRAEQEGLARDLCPYHTTMIGCQAAGGQGDYLEKIFAPPDIVLASNMPCMSDAKSYLAAVDRYGCPSYYLDAPINTWGRNVPQHAVDYYAQQLNGLWDFMAQHGFKADLGKLRQVVANSKEMSKIWREVDGYRAQRPTPMAMADGLTCMYLMYYLPGHAEALATFRRLRDEVRLRAEQKTGVIDDERYRLLLLGIPPYYNLSLLNYPERYGGVVVKGELEDAMCGVVDTDILDPERPFDTLARKLLTDWVNPTYANRVEMVMRNVRELHIDGIIALNKRGCRNLPAGFRLIKDAIAAEGVAMTIFDLDGIDLREYNDAQVKSNIDSFMETLGRG